MDVNAAPPQEPVPCSICQDLVVLPPSDGARSVALLKCNHIFHLDCIGSAFNARGTMQCPNCRDTEEGNWLDANRFQPSTDSNSEFGNGGTWGRLPLSNFLTTQSSIGGISSGIEGGPPADLSNVQVSDGTELRNSEIQQRYLAILRLLHLAARRPTNPLALMYKDLLVVVSNVQHGWHPEAGVLLLRQAMVMV